MLPGDRLVCVFVESFREGFQFKDWQLHITIVPWFRLNIASRKISKELEVLLLNFHAFSVHTGRENVGFGHQKRKKATLVNQPTPLAEIENTVRDYLHLKEAWLVDETTKSSRAFRPHITNQKNGSMHEGDIFICDRLFIIEQKGRFKEVVGEVRLG